jgi:tRNA modification GTPase
MTESTDTICAVSTAAGRSARGIVRLSGPEAIDVVARSFEPRDPCGVEWRRTFRVSAGEFLLRDSSVRVPVLLYVMRRPHSYTREDVVELHLPGSPPLLDMLLDDLLAQGGGSVRLAQPGEFSRRAFLNGRIDLSQAEAVLAVIRARSESELLAASAGVRGAAGRRCAGLLDEVTELRVQAEAALDFAPHGIELISEEDFTRRCRRVLHSCEQAVATGRELSAAGLVDVVLCGWPNAGKSTLLNRLVGHQRAIVHHQPGTTRDVVSAETVMDGMHFRFSDTAGLMVRAHGADEEAVHRAHGRIETAQIVLLVLDGSAPLPAALAGTVRDLPMDRVICLLNKQDLPQVTDGTTVRDTGLTCPVLRISAAGGDGVATLRREIIDRVMEGRVDLSAGEAHFNARQREAVRRAVDELAGADRAVADGMGYEFAAFNLRQAAEALQQVTGETVSADVLDRIFGRFCIGK